MTDKERAREIVRYVGALLVSTPEGSIPAKDYIEQQIIQALATVREECADIADQHASIEGIAQRIAQAIRSR